MTTKTPEGRDLHSLLACALKELLLRVFTHFKANKTLFFSFFLNLDLRQNFERELQKTIVHFDWSCAKFKCLSVPKGEKKVLVLT